MEWIPATISSEGSCSKLRTNKSKEINKKGTVKKSKGVVKLSTDPQSIAARERRHRISDRFKILQSMVPGGNKMDTVSMLEEAIHYVKFLKTQIWLHQTMINCFVDDQYSPTMFIPSSDQCYCCDSNEQHNLSLQQQNHPSVEESIQNLPQLPLDKFCLQGDQEDTIFNATMKYWPA